MNNVSQTINNFAKMEHKIFQIESVLAMMEKIIVPNRQIAEMPKTIY